MTFKKILLSYAMTQNACLLKMVSQMASFWPEVYIKNQFSAGAPPRTPLGELTTLPQIPCRMARDSPFPHLFSLHTFWCRRSTLNFLPPLLLVCAQAIYRSRSYSDYKEKAKTDAALIMCQADANNDKKLSMDEFVKAATTCTVVMNILRGTKWYAPRSVHSRSFKVIKLFEDVRVSICDDRQFGNFELIFHLFVYRRFIMDVALIYAHLSTSTAADFLTAQN